MSDSTSFPGHEKTTEQDHQQLLAGSLQPPELSASSASTTASVATLSWVSLENSMQRSSEQPSVSQEEQEEEKQRQLLREVEELGEEEEESVQEEQMEVGENTTLSPDRQHGTGSKQKGNDGSNDDDDDDDEEDDDDDESRERAQVARDLAQSFSDESHGSGLNSSDEFSGSSPPDSPASQGRAAGMETSEVAILLSAVSLPASASIPTSAPPTVPSSPPSSGCTASKGQDSASKFQMNLNGGNAAPSAAGSVVESSSGGETTGTEQVRDNEVQDCGCTAADDFPCPEKAYNEAEEEEEDEGGEHKKGGRGDAAGENDMKRAEPSSEDSSEDSSEYFAEYERVSEESKEQPSSVSTWSKACMSLQKPFLQGREHAYLGTDTSNSLSAMIKGMVLGIILGYLVNHAINKNRRIAMRELLEQRDHEIARLVKLLDKYTQIPVLNVVLKQRR